MCCSEPNVCRVSEQIRFRPRGMVVLACRLQAGKLGCNGIQGNLIRTRKLWAGSGRLQSCSWSPLLGGVSLIAIVILACLSPLILVVACLLICWLVPIVHSCRRIRVSVYMQITPKVKRQPRCGTFRVSMTSNRSFGIFFHVSVACTDFMGECAERAGKHEV